VRLSDADRERLFEALSAHAGAGRLSVEELERRIERAAAAQTRQDAAALLADLPPLPAGASDAAARRWWRATPHGERPSVDPSWRETDERFRDPGSGRVMRVWVDSSGGRHYVAEP
jgi:hypothetical protein